tara:strand:- start:771 stop:1796 length:1026 start_codon:yes stop_codon:yes gene_type:complete
MKYSEAIRDATAEIMRTHDAFVCGISVADIKDLYGTTEGLQEAFGTNRVFNTPLSEDSMTGMCVGAALGDMLPIHVHMRMDFMLLAMNQLINIAAKQNTMHGPNYGMGPMIVRTIIGRGWGQGAQHSQTPYSMLAHVPGIRVVAPVTPTQAYWEICMAATHPGPTVVVEHRMLYDMEGSVELCRPTREGRQSDNQVLREGTALTIVGISHSTVEALRAAEALAGLGIEAEVIGLTQLNPMELHDIEDSVKKTGVLITVEEAWPVCAVSSEIHCALSMTCDYEPSQWTCNHEACPTAYRLEQKFYPDATDIVHDALDLLDVAVPDHLKIPRAIELENFKGPF